MNKNSPLLSIIVPVYNVEVFIEECLNSIISQSFKDFELILINDGSTDSSLNICKQYSEKDNRIIIVNKPNGGLSTAKNSGLDIARGKYISFIDSDDFISKNYYSENMQCLINDKSIDILILQYCNYDNKKNSIFHNKKKSIDDKNKIIEYMLSKDYIKSSWINIYKKEVFNDLRFPIGKIYEDGFVLVEIIEKISKIYTSDSGIYFYRKRESSIMSKDKSLDQCFDILDCHTKILNYIYYNRDNKNLFFDLFQSYHLPLLYTILQFDYKSVNKYINKYESYKYNFNDLTSSDLSVKTILKLYLLSKIGFINMAKIYKLFLLSRKN